MSLNEGKVSSKTPIHGVKRRGYPQQGRWSKKLGKFTFPNIKGMPWKEVYKNICIPLSFATLKEWSESVFCI